MSGRGAWPKDGRGGTLSRKSGTTPPGPYYHLSVKPVPNVGLAGRNALRDGTVPSLDDLAVHYGVKAIQILLILNGAVLVADGVLGPASDKAIRAYQTKVGVTVDGSVGPNTMGRLLLPQIKMLAGEDWEVVYGLLKNEGVFDPGAVGYVDEQDLGLAQINGPSHPSLTMAQRFDPMIAIQFNVDYLRNAMKALNNVRDAVLAYNLGIGGVGTWIKAGRPRYWNPATKTSSPVANESAGFRDTTAYIDRVLNAYKEL